MKRGCHDSYPCRCSCSCKCDNRNSRNNDLGPAPACTRPDSRDHAEKKGVVRL